MEYLLDDRQMKKVDSNSIDEVGIPSVVLMERAALAVSGLVERLACERKASGRRHVRILCVCGKGNNGADGLAAARHLSQAGFDTDIYEVGKDGAGTEEYEVQKNIL